MHQTVLLTSLTLTLLIAGLSVAVRKFQIPAPIVMLLAGVGLAFVPGAPMVEIDPEIVLLVLLPPLLYSSGVGMSWRGFRSNLRPILLLAIGCVLFTMAAVAAIVHFAFGVPWAVGFVLGAIVSPPDSVAPMAVMRSMGLPRRLLTILEGESLVNDATALVAFSFALGAVALGSFSPGAAAFNFAAIVIGESLFGAFVGWTMLHLRHYAIDPRAEVLIALATPFIAFWPPHAIGGSGVVACVATGLYVSWNGRRLILPATRLQGFFIWNLVTWGTEALVFLLTGLQARIIATNLTSAEWTRALAAGAVVSVAVIIVRFVWVYPATYISRALPAVRRVDPFPNWRVPFLISFVGIRGVVSLVAALSIPLTLNGQPFPDRGLVLVATFCTIAVTLVGLGLTLPAVVRFLGLRAAGAREARQNKRDERNVRIEGLSAALAALDQAEKDGAPPIAIKAARHQFDDRYEQLSITANEKTRDDAVTDSVRLEMRLLDVEREAIGKAYKENRLTDEARRRIEREFDLEEARIRHLLVSATDISDDEIGDS